MAKSIIKKVLISLTLTASMVLSGCATVDPDLANPDDPFEGFNRTMYSFNSGLDNAVLKPVARGYNAIVPAPINRGVSNFFNNLGDVGSAINNLLQFKVGRATSDVGRILINSTIGVLGFFDVATNMDFPRYKEDFGQTLGTWGVASGPFIVLPFLGPSSGRDAVGTVVDWYTDPITYIEDDEVRWGLRGIELIDKRADLLGASRVLDQAAIDPYAFIRDAYLQKRQYDVHDGNPPEEDFDN